MPPPPPLDMPFSFAIIRPRRHPSSPQKSHQKTPGLMFSGPFTKLLKRSPLDDIQQHMQVAVESAREVPGLLRALRDQNTGEFSRIKTRIYDAENAADKIKNELRGRLPRTLFMPIARRDLLEVLHFQDSIADTAQNIADLLDERSMKIPAKLEEPLISLAESSVRVCEFSLRIIQKLDELVGVGFRGAGARRVREMTEQLNLFEHEADEIERDLSRALFEIESELDPVSVIMWYRIIEWIGDLADHAEKVGDRVRLFVAR
ncbi:MAG: Phosphate transport regulator (distant homolog of PhoU) [Arenicellales bacterium IbO2]|nr:MAG: Phosphate transport regulator (distant homolog of PhoU) [Arenicellales bacterium IbO2]